jgi:SAM-dependent methyltransferase
MIRIAKKKTPAGLHVEYHRGSCEKLDFLADRSFDKMISNMVMGDLADLDSALGEMHRLLRPEGCFIFTILHPCFATSSGRWERDSDGKALYWRVDKYFEEGPYEVDLSPVDASGNRGKDQKGIIEFHRTLATYLRAIRRAGLIISDLAEPLPNEEKLK